MIGLETTTLRDSSRRVAQDAEDFKLRRHILGQGYPTC